MKKNLQFIHFKFQMKSVINAADSSQIGKKCVIIYFKPHNFAHIFLYVKNSSQIFFENSFNNLIFSKLTGIGLVEEMPISAIPLFVANPQILMNQERNFYAAPRLDEEETGTHISFKVSLW